ncbi:MAG: hypothetical protein D6729_08915 [Deltaproteobacteria bacterium]|nr:MAG: hypothetical protein D6729_08915 [Deltaproteobacteria bacterium]
MKCLRRLACPFAALALATTGAAHAESGGIVREGAALEASESGAEPPSSGPARAVEPAPLDVPLPPSDDAQASADQADDAEQAGKRSAATPEAVETSEEEEATPREAARRLWVVHLKDGQLLRGYLVSEEPARVVLQLPAGGRVVVERHAIASMAPSTRAEVRHGEEVWFKDPHASRFFYAPSALRPKAGYGYFSQKQLLFSEFAYGVTDSLSLIVGAVVPAWFVGVEGINVTGGGKIGFSLAEELHLAAGAQALVLPGSQDLGAFGFVFGTGTLGNADRQITVNVGWPFSFTGRLSLTGRSGEIGSLIVVASGAYRFSKHFAVMTENWVLPFADWGDTVPAIFSLGLRVMWEALAADVGAVWQPALNFPIPWLGFSWAFQVVP